MRKMILGDRVGAGAAAAYFSIDNLTLCSRVTGFSEINFFTSTGFVGGLVVLTLYYLVAGSIGLRYTGKWAIVSFALIVVTWLHAMVRVLYAMSDA